MRGAVKGLVALAVAAAVMIAAFGAGVASAPYLNRTMRVPVTLAGPTLASARTEHDLSLFMQAWRVIEQDYYGQPLDQGALLRGAIQGLVAATGDPSCAYLTSDQVAGSDMELDGSLHSLGMAVEKRGDTLVVIAPLAASPAQRAGIHPGDLIIRINERDTASLTLGEAISLLRGATGSHVSLTLVRENSGVVTLTVERGSTPEMLVHGTMLADGIAYVNISAFSSSTPRQLAAFLQGLDINRLRGIILDVRNNPGGYLDAAVEVAGCFIPEGTILTQRGAKGTVTWSYTDGGKLLIVDGPDGKRVLPVRTPPLAAEVPLVVLVNRGTASAAEVLAAALQDHKRAVLMGQQTFGKGTVSGDYPLSDGSLIRLTNGQWLSPKGRSVTEVGITPDIVVESAQADSQEILARAMEYLLLMR